jgi:hypothetical protein
MRTIAIPACNNHDFTRASIEPASRASHDIDLPAQLILIAVSSPAAIVFHRPMPRGRQVEPAIERVEPHRFETVIQRAHGGIPAASAGGDQRT